MPEVQKRQRVRIGYQPTMQSLSAGGAWIEMRRSATRRRTSPAPWACASTAGTLGRRKKKPGLQGELSPSQARLFLCLPDSFAYWQCSIFAAAGWAVSNLEKSVSSRSASILLFRMSRNVTSCVINSNSRMEKSTRTNRFSTSSLLR